MNHAPMFLLRFASVRTIGPQLAQFVGAGRGRGGAGLQAAENAELVVRTDGANDALTISTSILANCYKRSFEPIPCVISATTPRD